MEDLELKCLYEDYHSMTVRQDEHRELTFYGPAAPVLGINELTELRDYLTKFLELETT